ncbi:MAG TPA: thioredoxin-dependent thiol peroxidase [Egibacteraceae bacterium]|nr:thioredoxin-dependent thiol peroxidase [Egibacteraceae bacterium]
MNVEVGATAPQFTLVDQHGEKWALKDRRGAPVVVYFYPKDDTPGCTAQSCDVRDHWGEFAELGVEVVGISPDDHHSHAAFAARYGLPHTLLADPTRKVIEKYGAWGEKSMYGKKFTGVIRSSVVIDARGKVAAVFPRITPPKQSEKTLAVVRDLVGV